MLEIRDKNNDDDDDDDENDVINKEIGADRYRQLQDIWQEQHMTTFHDFLQYYNNLDVGPFVQAVEKMQKFYSNQNIDLFKVAVSVPGIARRWLFQTAHNAKTSFALIDTRDDDLYYTIKQNIVGGPSIIFTRDAEVERTHIRDDLNRPCANIVGYDANALYLDCIDKAMPCGGYVRRAAPDFKPDSRLSCEDMFNWMDYIMETEGVHILHDRNHISEVLEPCMNLMDAIFMDVQTVRKTKMIWVRRGKCIQRPRKNLSVPKVTIWGSYGNMNSSHKRNWTLNWSTLFDNDNLPSIASIVG